MLCFVLQCSAKQLHLGQGWHVLLNVSVWFPRVKCHSTMSTYWGGRCWSQPRSWPWRSLRSVWGPAGRWGCSPSAAALGSDSPTPPWRPGREEKTEKVQKKSCDVSKTIETEPSVFFKCRRESNFSNINKAIWINIHLIFFYKASHLKINNIQYLYAIHEKYAFERELQDWTPQSGIMQL